MKNKITLLMMVGCMLFSRTTIINAMMEGYDYTTDTDEESWTENDSSLGTKTVVGDGSTTTLDTTTDTNTTSNTDVDPLLDNNSQTKTSTTVTLDLSGGPSQDSSTQLIQLNNGLLSNADGELVDDQGRVYRNFKNGGTLVTRGEVSNASINPIDYMIDLYNFPK